MLLAATVSDPDEQMTIDAARLERQTRHQRMRNQIRWLTRTRFFGKQAQLAGTLNVSSQWLSQYMTEKSSKGVKLDEQQLNVRFSTITHALRRADLPTEAPAAAEATTTDSSSAAANAAADATATDPSTASKPSATNPVSVRPKLWVPKAAVLSVKLADVSGWKEGGHCHIMALGVPVLGDGRWEIYCPGSSDGSVLHLRVGLRGRRTLSAKSHASVAGRVLEWWIEVMECRHDISCHGGPLWVARELNSSMTTLGQRIIGRAALERRGYSGGSSPELLWRAISRYCGPEALRFTGVACTGLIHPSVQALLLVVEEEGDGIPSLTGFGSRCGGVGGLKARRLREIGAASSVAFVQAMESICPGDPEAAFTQLLKRRSFQKFLPEHVQKALGKNALRDAALELPFVAGLVEVFHKLEGFRARRQHLSLFAPFFPYSVTMALFGATRWQVYA
jgi:hypothetical protein